MKPLPTQRTARSRANKGETDNPNARYRLSVARSDNLNDYTRALKVRVGLMGWTNGQHYTGLEVEVAMLALQPCLFEEYWVTMSGKSTSRPLSYIRAMNYRRIDGPTYLYS